MDQLVPIATDLGTQFLSQMRALVVKIGESPQWFEDPSLQKHFLLGWRCSPQEILGDREMDYPLLLCVTHQVLVFRDRLGCNACGLHIGVSDSGVAACAKRSFGKQLGQGEHLLEIDNDLTLYRLACCGLVPGQDSGSPNCNRELVFATEQLATLAQACDAEQLYFRVQYRD